MKYFKNNWCIRNICCNTHLLNKCPELFTKCMDWMKGKYIGACLLFWSLLLVWFWSIDGWQDSLYIGSIVIYWLSLMDFIIYIIVTVFLEKDNQNIDKISWILLNDCELSFAFFCNNNIILRVLEVVLKTINHFLAHLRIIQ